MSKKRIAILIILLAAICCGCICLAIIKVNDYIIEFNDPPKAITLEYGEAFEEPEVTAIGYGTILHKKPEDLTITRSGEVDENTLGTYTLTYETTFKKEVSKRSIQVTVVDTIAPEITLVADPEHFTSPIAEYEEEGFSATDNHDGDITDKVIRTPGEGIVTYTVSDSSGNETSVVRTIVYKDVVPPEITLEGKAEVTLEVGSTYSEPGYTATDDVDGDITDWVEVDKNSLDTSTPGTYTLTYRVKDGYDNEASATRTVIVYRKQTTSKNPGNKVVYLSFDDGPYKYTDTLLDVLDKYNVKATFFVTNQYPGYRYLIGEEAKRGHTVAIHTYSHNYAKIYSSVDAYYEDLNAMSDIIEAQTGHKPTLFRFPGGSSNLVSKKYCDGVVSSIAATLSNDGYLYCDWNITSGDSGDTTSTDQIVTNVINGMKKHNISYVLQHDIKDFSVNAVEKIIQWGLENGYTFLPMDETTPMYHHTIGN